MKETDLYPLLKKYFENQGFLVQAEVNSVDIVAIKDDLVIIVEMKTQLNLKLIYQGCQRQKIGDNVYLAVPRINNKKTFKERLHILRRLNLGLLIVDMENENVEAIIDPIDFVFRKSKKKKQKLLAEMNQRVTNVNVGGTSKSKLVIGPKAVVIGDINCANVDIEGVFEGVFQIFTHAYHLPLWLFLKRIIYQKYFSCEKFAP